jgi:hypothetical protein
VSGAVAEQHRRQQHDRQQRDRRRRGDEQRVLVTVEQINRGEHHAAEHGQRDDIEQGLRDDRAEHDRQMLTGTARPARHDQRARWLTEARRQCRGHQHADERALHGIR